ncbi:hypothetical protein NC797_16205 [Aquibacillus sp. 3ASR75-11]|uniref:Uncharacterized protein n=1 Tax=Terrihalobacillus insolitus TaxID=2950438 RepID=A0A9X3WXH1_9BACI|nr:hypothetical protein [Terrihalobacillus insolitus]MDC3414487.1 hypothetical protein [Terrihalobacillus insolitus]MDC3426046.1 hypothetical protein [Terrihalobacillus insolitus]
MKILKDNGLWLRPIQLPEDLAIAFPWYQDKEVLYYSDGEGTLPCDLKINERMYNYLKNTGEPELFIENQR